MRRRYYVVTSLLLGLVLAIGFAVAWGAAMIWCGSVIDSVNRGDQVRRDLYFLSDGRPVIVTYAFSGYQTTAIRTLEGEQLPESAQQRLTYPSYLSVPKEEESWLLPMGWSERIVGMNDGGVPPVYWYLIHDGQPSGRAYLAGYHSRSERLVGYIGRGGFRTTLPPRDDRFPIDGRRMARHGGAAVRYSSPGYIPTSPMSYGDDGLPPGRQYLLTDDGLVALDLQAHTVRLLLQPAEVPLSASVITVPLPKPPDAPEHFRPSRQELAFAYRDRIELFDPRTEESRAYPLPPDLRRPRTHLYLQAVPSGELVLIDRQTATDPITRLTWLSPGGKITRREEVAIQQYHSWIDDHPEWAATAVVPCPVMSVLITFLALPMTFVESSQAADYPAGLAQSWSRSWLPLVLVFALNLIPVWLVWRRQQEYAGRGTVAWMLLVYLLGPAGWVGYRFHRFWPARSTLPTLAAAGALSPGGRHPSGGDMPRPAATGLEVYG